MKDETFGRLKEAKKQLDLARTYGELGDASLTQLEGMVDGIDRIIEREEGNDG